MLVPHFILTFFQAQAPGNGHPHNIFSFSIPTLISIVALKHQNQQNSPFETHPEIALSGVLVLLLYCMALDYHQRLGMRINRPLALDGFIHRCVLFLGYMATSILVSLIIPDSASLGAVYVLCVAVSVGDVVVFGCREMGGWLRRRMIGAELLLLPL